MNTIQNLQTARNWHDNHYEHTTPDSHQGRWRQFIEIDPFNPENRLEGHIQMQGGDEYGALAIHTVNGKPAPQFIRTMPKTTYPFFKDGSWVLTGMESLEAYCKLDGTNICQFGYQDTYGKEFTTFKVRIRPFMAPHFISLMERCFQLYPGVRDRKLRPRQACMYELYGHENPQDRISTPGDPLLSVGRAAPLDQGLNPRLEEETDERTATGTLQVPHPRKYPEGLRRVRPAVPGIARNRPLPRM